MASKIKNIIIFLVIGAVFILIYIFFIKAAPSPASLFSSSASPAVGSAAALNMNPSVAKEFLTLLLSVKNIKLDDAIFSDNAFSSLHDSSIILTPDGNEGRPNPFAPFGTENITPPTTPDGNAPVPVTR